MVLLLLLVPNYGILGAILAVFVASLLAYPFVVYQIRPYRGWYPGSDVLLCFMGIGVAVVMFWVNPEVLQSVQETFFRGD
jgi:hypothetical protein